MRVVPAAQPPSIDGAVRWAMGIATGLTALARTLLDEGGFIFQNTFPKTSLRRPRRW